MRRSRAFRRNNVIIDTDQTPEGSLAAIAEPLLTNALTAARVSSLRGPQAN
jgi:hypothetical protein